MDGKERLWYKAPPKVHAALLRGTTADLDGNVSFEKEALNLDSLNMVCTTVMERHVMHGRFCWEHKLATSHCILTGAVLSFINAIVKLIPV